MKEFKIDIITIVAIVLIVLGLVALTFYYASYREKSCTINPVKFIEDNWKDYYTDKIKVLVIPSNPLKRLG